MRQEPKSVKAPAGALSAQEEPFSAKAPWYYASIQFGEYLMGLLVETDDEEEARREAEELRTCFGAQARVLSVRKVVIQ